MALPGEHISAQNFAGGILLSGQASSTAAADRAMAIAERYAPKAVSSTINVTDSTAGHGRGALHRGQPHLAEGPRLQLRRPGPGGGFTLNSGTGLAGNQPPQATVSFSKTFGAWSVDASLTRSSRRA